MPPPTIRSHSNTKIKLALSLRLRRARETTGLFLVEGIRPVTDAVASGWPVVFILYAPDLLRSEHASELIQHQSDAGLPCLPVSAEVFASLAAREHPQGILAVARIRRTALADLHPRNFERAVALAAPQDPGNVGAVLRTVDAVGAGGLILLDHSADVYHPVAVRASMGAIFWRPVVRVPFADFTAWSAAHRYHVWGAAIHGSDDFRKVQAWPRPFILLLGSEREGLSAEQAAICERLIHLPMAGHVDSLNLAVAAGVLLYAMVANLPESPPASSASIS